jgi:hypothetical protein
MAMLIVTARIIEDAAEMLRVVVTSAPGGPVEGVTCDRESALALNRRQAQDECERLTNVIVNRIERRGDTAFRVMEI